MFEKAKEVLRKYDGGTDDEEYMSIARECYALLKHLENLDKKAEYMKKGWEFIEANLLDELVNKREYYIMLRMLKKSELKVLEFIVFADTPEQALNAAIKSLEQEGK